MPHYKSPDNTLHFLDDDSYAYLLPAGAVSITDEEADALRQGPEPVIPSIVSMKQAQLALFRAGLLDAVESAIAAGGREDQITWAKSQTVERSDPLVTNMAAALNLSKADLDNLFTLAAGL